MKQLTKLLAIIACFAFVTSSVFAQAQVSNEKKAQALVAIESNLPDGKTLAQASEAELAEAIKITVAAANASGDTDLENAIVAVALDFSFEVDPTESVVTTVVAKVDGTAFSTDEGSAADNVDTSPSSTAPIVVKNAIDEDRKRGALVTVTLTETNPSTEPSIVVVLPERAAIDLIGVETASPTGSN